MLLGVTLADTGECRPFKCKQIPLGECGVFSEEEMKLQACPGDTTCDFYLDMAPYLNQTDYTVKCLPDSERGHPLTFKGALDAIDSVCATTVTAATPRLVRQSLFTTCLSDQDCLLTNGSYTSCVCGMNGTRYCTYGPGDEVYVNLTTAACEKDWNQYLLLGIYVAQQGNLLSYPDCAPDVLNDFSFFVYLREGGDAYREFGMVTWALQLVLPFLLSL